MKRFFSILIAAVVILTYSMTAFAEVKVDDNAVTESGTTSTGVTVTVNENEVVTSGKDPQYVSVDGTASPDTLTVNGNIGETKPSNSAITAKNGATITVNGNVNESDSGHGISVSDGSSVMVDGDVNESDNGYAIYAFSSAENVQTPTQVTVTGNVTGADGDAIFVLNSKDEEITIIIGENVSGDIRSDKHTSIIVEGSINGNVKNMDVGEVYAGALNGNITGNQDNVHYLIGMADGGAQLADITFGGNVESGTITGADQAKSYRYTSTADASSGLTITLKASNGGKQLKDYDGVLPEGVEKSYNNGVLTLVLNSGFKGGLQNLQLLIEDIVRKTSSNSGGLSRPIFTGTAGNPVTNGKWAYDEATDTWSYKTTYKFTDTWGYIADPDDSSSAAWYYFDKNGNMLTGWHKIVWNGVPTWFYFIETKDASRGKCQLGGITPDGYRLAENGALIES